MIASTDMKPL